MYAFTYDAYDEAPLPPNSRYSSPREHEIEITVVAESQDEALFKAKEVAEREVYYLGSISAISNGKVITTQ